jgi:transcription antitermination factor NusG
LLLEESKITYYLPREKVVSQWHDRKKIIDKPLFPSYIFVCLQSLSNYYTIKELDGVCYFVKFGNQLATIPERVINNIKLITTRGSDISIYTERLAPGLKMTITEGPLCGLECEVHKINDKDIACVRVNLLNRIIFAAVPSHKLATIH